MNHCSRLISLSAFACELANCLSDQEIALLSSDLVVLSDMLANLLTQKEVCSDEAKKD